MLALSASAVVATAQPQAVDHDRVPATQAVADTASSANEVTGSPTNSLSSFVLPVDVIGPVAYSDGIGGRSSQSWRVQPNPSVWRDLFGATAGDIKKLPSRRTFGMLAIGAAAAIATRAADKGVSRSLSANKTLEEPLEPGAVLGSTPFQLSASLTTYALARLTHHPRLTQVGADLVRAQLLAEGLTIGMKQSFRRQRPEGSGFAFPSGHTTVSFASATVLQRHYGWKLGLPAYGIASYVALSRVQMRRHYLSDVAFGAALGIVAGRTVTIGHGPTFAILPAPTPGGAALQFTLVGKGSRR